MSTCASAEYHLIIAHIHGYSTGRWKVKVTCCAIPKFQEELRADDLIPTHCNLGLPGGISHRCAVLIQTS